MNKKIISLLLISVAILSLASMCTLIPVAQEFVGSYLITIQHSTQSAIDWAREKMLETLFPMIFSALAFVASTVGAILINVKK